MRIILTFLLNAGLNFAVGLVTAGLLGPDRYGRYAVGVTAAGVIATGLFDWLRLSTTRFYGEAQRRREPSLRRTADYAYRGLAGLLACAAVLAMLLPFPATATMIAAVAAMAFANGAFDYRTALARARFLNGPYAAMVIGKGVIGLGLACCAGLLGYDPALLLAIQAVGMLIALAPVNHRLADAAAPDAVWQPALLGRFARYGLPIVSANVVFQGCGLLLRSAAAGTLGFAAAGHLSLAMDLELRLLLASGAAIDVLVFQLAVRSESLGGRAAAETQLRDNIVVVAAVLAMLATGFAMTLPAFTALIVPARFQDGFAALALTLLPGVFLFCIGQFALNPVFQMQHRTMPITGSALVSAATIGVGLLVFRERVGPLGFAAVHAGGLATGFVVLAVLAFRSPAVRPHARDIVGIVCAAALMAACLTPVRLIGPPALSLAVAALVGPAAFAAALLACDVGLCRRVVRPWLARFGEREAGRRLA